MTSWLNNTWNIKWIKEGNFEMGMLAFINKTHYEMGEYSTYTTPAQFWWQHAFLNGSEILIASMHCAWFGFDDTIVPDDNYTDGESISPFFYMGVANKRMREEVGIYSAGYVIPQRSIFTIVSLLALASAPIAYNVWEKQGVEASQDFLSKLTRYYLLVGFPATVGLSVLSKPVMRALTAPMYFPGYRVIPFVAFSVFLVGITNRFSVVLGYHKRTNLIMFCNLTCATLNLGLNFLFIPKYGYVAAAATTLVAFAADLLIKIGMSRHFLVWQFPFKSFGKIVVASAVMSIIVYRLGNSLSASNPVNLMVGICTGAVVYSAMLLLLRELRPEEIREVRALAFRVLKLR